MRLVFCLGFTLSIIAGVVSGVAAQGERGADAGQSRQSMANDQSAAQWTFLLGYQWMEYHTDETAPGETRSKGNSGSFVKQFVGRQRHAVLQLRWRFGPAVGNGNQDGQGHDTQANRNPDMSEIIWLVERATSPG